MFRQDVMKGAALLCQLVTDLGSHTEKMEPPFKSVVVQVQSGRAAERRRGSDASVSLMSSACIAAGEAISLKGFQW